MSVRRDKNGKFIIDYYPNGRKGKRERKVLPASVVTEEQAKMIEAALLNTSKKKVNIKETYIIKNLTQRFFDFIKIYKRKNTVIDYEIVFNAQIIPHFGKLTIPELTTGHMELFKAQRQTDGVSNRTINKELSYFYAFLNWADDEAGITIPPLKRRKLPITDKKPVVLSQEEVIRFINACGGYHKLFFCILYYCGLRISECCNIKTEDVDTGSKKIYIREGKGGKDRFVPIPDFLTEPLDYHVNITDSEYLFPSPFDPNKPHSRDFRGIIESAKERAGITKKIYPHLFRHTYATHLVDADVTDSVIQTILGHADAETTRIYQQVAITKMKSAQSKLTDYNKDLIIKKTDYNKFKKD